MLLELFYQRGQIRHGGYHKNLFSYTAMHSIFDVKVCFSDCSQGSMRCKHVWIRMTRLAMLDDSSTDSFGRRSTCY